MTQSSLHNPRVCFLFGSCAHYVYKDCMLVESNDISYTLHGISWNKHNIIIVYKTRTYYVNFMYFLFSYGASLQTVFETSMIGLTPLLTSSRTTQIQHIYTFFGVSKMDKNGYTI